MKRIDPSVTIVDETFYDYLRVGPGQQSLRNSPISDSCDLEEHVDPPLFLTDEEWREKLNEVHTNLYKKYLSVSAMERRWLDTSFWDRLRMAWRHEI